MNINELITFKKAAELLNFSNTAKELNYSQSAITIQIKNLEGEFGIQLFDRVGKNVRLTPAGEALLEHAYKIINEVETAKSTIGKHSAMEHTLRVGCIDSICLCHFPEILKKVIERKEAISFSIVTGSPDKLLDMMNKNQLDLVYILDKPIHNSKWVKAFEAIEPLHFVTSSKSDLAKNKRISIKDIVDKPFYLTEDNINYRLALEEKLAEKGLEITPSLEVSNTDVIIKTLQDSGAISFLPKYSFEKELDQGLVAILPVRNMNLTMKRQLFYHSNKYLSREMKVFIDIVSHDLK
ncbi:MAG: LysR family transcriptional regulator [Tissierellia bacterium]|nr:LysR family transcriptional regulator [Tissierellia bacterium]